jgi:hypothetical protein
LSAGAIADQVETWDITRAKNTKLPSKTDLDKMLRAQVIDILTYRTEMAKLGYAKGYTDWYLALIQKGLETSGAETD